MTVHASLTLATVYYEAHPKLATRVRYVPIAFVSISTDPVGFLEEVSYFIQHVRIGTHIKIVSELGDTWEYTRTHASPFLPPCT